MGSNQVVYDYDYSGDSLFIYCVDSYEYDVSLELDNDVILDLDVDGKPVAFEFLNASKLFKLNKNYLNDLKKINIQSTITEEAITLNVKLTVPVPNKNQIFDINRVTSNIDNIPVMETELVNA